MIEVSQSVKIEENEIQFDFIRASGPGGQNVNKVATSVQLRFDVRNSPSLAPEIKERLIKLAGSRMTEDGILIIEAKRHRTQEGNRQDALERLSVLVQKALVPPTVRKRIRPSGTGRAREKRHRSEIKRLRRYIPEEWD